MLRVIVPNVGYHYPPKDTENKTTMIDKPISNIKPCPFCKGKGEIITIYGNTEEDCMEEFHDVRCLNTTCYLWGGANWKLSKKEAIELWNKRK